MASHLRRFSPVCQKFVRTLSHGKAAPATEHTPTRKTLASLQSLYASSKPITMIAAYDYPSALHADRAGVDITLVGDSLAMVVLGHRTTQAATLDNMVHHAQAARRATKSAFLVADLPFGCYETNPERAVDSAIRLVKEASVDAVKLEGASSRCKSLTAIVDAGVAVMGHVGLLPQSVSREGAFRAAGRTASSAKQLIHDALAVQEAGAFAMVVECVPSRVARLLTAAVDIPTIGIGSGSGCSGQVLVYHDMLGILNHPHHNAVTPKFCKEFAHLAPLIDSAIRDYCHQVRDRQFPDHHYSPYNIPDSDVDELDQYIRSLVADGDKSPSKFRHTRLPPDGRPPLNDDPVTLY